ncbi:MULTISPECIES: bifunctional 2-polyprenyl-6-hydroxyphenol methylase/3-demethylubiquinol 3-O-methyltransferase UbiG [unclassified Rathayibacter]|uniref:class I SAM-dependent methyltransferase n=1 Tax=unclassified Rathayibacter TaxID=2609250 RepID=UPI000CE7F2DB|nr:MULTISPECIES: class I SAM-dependent methyltransferase [unclassified Rathayibacter]PPF26257.1 class I SAM-dependent methyltransferase [Rathayibacter sp. AY1F2]PPH42277.1 class I SAM-dependent methyltransferase [Rathayibacter sp. AY1F7]
MATRHPKRWNHNVHYQQRILEEVPADARTALDVGTGEGIMAAELHTMIPAVTGLDLDPLVLERAQEEDPGVNWVQGDLMTSPLPPASFDVVTAIATIHHLPDLDRTLRRRAELTAPGGLVGVVGLARTSTPRDALYDLAGLLQHRAKMHRHSAREHSAATAAPVRTYAEMRRSADRILPGHRWARLPMWRYVMTWRRPR